MKKIYYNSNLKEYARKLRKESTLAEVLLWQQLRRRQVKGYKFTRQKPIEGFIVDFYCVKLRLAIEIDGSSHDEKETEDRIRQKKIEQQGIRFLRYLDRDVKQNLNGVIESIIDWIEQEEKVSSVRP